MNTRKPIDKETIERAKRARSARKFAGLTMEKLNSDHQIPPSTLQGWENTGSLSLKNRSLTLKGAQRLVNALEIEGVTCSIEWLMDGTGRGPQFTTTQNESKNSLWGQSLSLQYEIKAFEENNANAVVVMIADNVLAPFYDKGEIVAGVKYYLEDISQFAHRFCIIETKRKEVLIRKLIPGKQPHHYLLHTHDNADKVSKEIKVNWVAPILWHRKLA